jgi:MoxR-vWA-beta-propeller ternary system domain bpX5
VTWRPRFTPLVPVGVAARGTAATSLAHRLLKDPDSLSHYKAVGAPGLLVILGEEKWLPWVDGVVYLGHDAQSPSFLFPTNLEPSVPATLLQRSVALVQDGPCALLLDPAEIIPLSEARTVARDSLVKWLEADL